MSKPSMYDIQRREVEPVADLLKAVLEVNWHLRRAEDAGWALELSVNDIGVLGVEVTRSAGWPSEESEAADALARENIA